MKYLFFGISWIFRKFFGIIFYSLAQAFIFIWNFDLKNNEGYNDFWENVEIGSGDMLRWTVIFLVLTIICAIFGFGGLLSTSAGIAKVMFFIFMVLFIISLIAGNSIENNQHLTLPTMNTESIVTDFKSNTVYYVHHEPSKEDWVIIGVNPEQDRCCVAGYPPTIANLYDCTDIEEVRPITQEEIEYRNKTFGDCWL